ncbi:Ribonucleoside-diphosphate reductase large [Seminavis robusta]|uniref:Ribonucleoside-diphosphate reductase n=1 Tax=Seminavis robusta TaxID=568900 RepID=A0A9N8EBZ1_9STRA|nr:Ribonucleoside-diphosphate reductase large [Seminavis robusta]|eukprot:Sro785_g202090.1 Ribonucleoside-diphosphate reductase large (894) ;mRNA; r:11054-14008
MYWLIVCLCLKILLCDPVLVPVSALKPPTNSILIGSRLNLSFSDPNDDISDDGVVYMINRQGNKEVLDEKKILSYLQSRSDGLDHRFLDLPALAETIRKGTYPNVKYSDVATLSAETAASLSTQHPDYARLAASILIDQNHKVAPPTFSQAVEVLYDNGNGFIHQDLAGLVRRRKEEINARVKPERDRELLTYFGFKTLEKSYLLRNKTDEMPVETPQYLFMRVALGIHCCSVNNTTDNNLSEDQRIQAAFETYDLLSQGFISHASPTLFHSGTTHPQLCSCFLVQMADDSIHGIYDTLKTCAVISKAAGGIGLSVHNIRARGTEIKGTRGTSNGLVPMLRVYDVTARYVDQGGGKRPGAIAIYLEPWHADVFDVLNLKRNHGKEEQRARDLFYALWIPDLFMKRVEEDGVWSLMCPHLCKGLAEVYGDAFEDLYQKYEAEGRYVRQIRARDLWSAILEAQIETGTPYMLYKDAANRKSNQNNLGTITSSNLCTEIIQYTDKEEVAVCNLASLCLSRFVVSNRGPFGSIDPSSGNAYFDHEALHRATKIVTRNLNKIIDINSYPVKGSEVSNKNHRPIGIGVSGLADAFIRLGLPFTSNEARQLNQAIFETIYHAALETSAEEAEKHGPYHSFAGSPASKGLLQFDLWDMKSYDTPSNLHARIRKEDGGDVQSSKNGFPRQLYPESCRGKGYNWDALKQRIISRGLRNSLFVAPMPTASTSQILGVNECFEPFSSNLYIRRVKAGEFIMANPHLLQDLTDRGLWTPAVRNQLMRDGGSVANIPSISPLLKELYKTVWEIKMKDIIDMAADRGKFIDQSQSLNLFLAEPTLDKLTAMHFYAWKKGLKTGMYYLRTKPAVNAIQYTVDKDPALRSQGSALPEMNDPSAGCISCQG